MLRVRGMAGGITSGVTYLGIDPGGSVPPGTCASALREPKRIGRKSAAPPAALYCRKRRRFIVVIAVVLLPLHASRPQTSTCPAAWSPPALCCDGLRHGGS